MNALVRTLVVFVLLAGVVIVASLVYRNTMSETPTVETATNPEPQPVDETNLNPEIKLGLDALRDDRPEDAIAHFRAVPVNDPDYPTALRHLAVQTARRGDYDEAVESLKRLVVQQPDDPEVHASLGWVFYLAKRYEEAELAALRTLELDAGHLSTRYNIGLYRIAQGRTNLAISSYIRAMRADPDGQQVTRHRDRLRDLHEELAEAAGPHYGLAFFANSMQDPRTEISELEHFLELAVEGPLREAAQRQLDQARANAGGA